MIRIRVGRKRAIARHIVLFFVVFAMSNRAFSVNAEEVWPKHQNEHWPKSSFFKNGKVFESPWHGYFFSSRADLDIFIRCPTRRYFLQPCKSPDFLDLIKNNKFKIIQKGTKLIALEDIFGNAGPVHHQEFGDGYVDFAVGF